MSESVRAKDDMRVSVWKTCSSGEIKLVLVAALSTLLGVYLSISKLKVATRPKLINQ